MTQSVNDFTGILYCPITFNMSFNITKPQLKLWEIYAVEQRIWYGVMVASCAIGTIASILLIAAILSSRTSRKGTGILMVNLLVKVTLQCGIAIPMLIQSYPGVPYSITNVSVFCPRAHFLYNALIPSIDYADLMIGLNRFIAICLPHAYPRWMRPRAVYGMVTFSWITALFYAVVPQIPGMAVFKNLAPWYSCGVVYSPFWSVFFAVGGIAVPVVMLLMLYFMIFVVVMVRKSIFRQKVSPLADSATQRKMQRRFRSTKIFFTVFVCYACCMAPAPLTAPLFPQEYVRLPFLRQILRALMTAGTASIPVLYFLFNAKYRRQVFHCRWYGKMRPRARTNPSRTRGRSLFSATGDGHDHSN